MTHDPAFGDRGLVVHRLFSKGRELGRHRRQPAKTRLSVADLPFAEADAHNVMVSVAQRVLGTSHTD